MSRFIIIAIAAIVVLSGCAGRKEAISVADALSSTNLSAKEKVDDFFNDLQDLNRDNIDFLRKNAKAFSDINNAGAPGKFRCLSLISDGKVDISQAYHEELTLGLAEYLRVKEKAIAAFKDLNTPLTNRLKQAQVKFKANPTDSTAKLEFYSLYVQVRENEQTFDTEFSEKADKVFVEYLTSLGDSYKEAFASFSNLAIQNCESLPETNVPDLSEIKSQLMSTATLLNDSNVLSDSEEQFQNLLDANAMAGSQIKNYFAFYSAETISNFVFSLPKDFLGALFNSEEYPDLEQAIQAAKKLGTDAISVVEKDIEDGKNLLVEDFQKLRTDFVEDVEGLGNVLTDALAQ